MFLAVLVWRISGPFNVVLFLFLVCARRPRHPTLKGRGTYNYPHFVKLIMSVVVCHGANYPYNANRKKKEREPSCSANPRHALKTKSYSATTTTTRRTKS